MLEAILPSCIRYKLTKTIYSTATVVPTKYKYKYRVQCMSPRRIWDSPTPSHASECSSPQNRGGGGGGAHSPAV